MSTLGLDLSASAADPGTAGGRWSGRLRRPEARVLAFSFALMAIGAVALVVVLPRLGPGALHVGIGLPIFALMYFAAEAKVIDVHFRGGTVTFSLTEVPAVIGLFFVSPFEYVAGIMIGASLALVRARQPAPKLAFNLGQFLLGSIASLVVFQMISGVGGAQGLPGPMDWVAAFTAMLTTALVSAVAIATAHTISGREGQFGRIPEALQVGGLIAVTNTALALLVVEIVVIEPSAVWLVAIPVGTLYIAYRAYLSERLKHESLELLYESSQIFQRSPALDSAILAMLEHARVMFSSGIAELVLVGADDGIPLRTSTGPAKRTETMVAAPERAPILARLDRDPRSFIHYPDPATPRSARSTADAIMISPLLGESGVIGAMCVADPNDDTTVFSPDQLRILETVANQAAVALENGHLEQSLANLSRLKEELRHQAFHDPLTGLANGAMFTQSLEERYVTAPSDTDATTPGIDPIPPVVLFLDMDDFKIVNDTIGHDAGDRVLKEVSARLSLTIRANDLVARLGGDEFGILLAEGTRIEDAKNVARRIANSLGPPVKLKERDFDIGASIGLAVGDPDSSAEELLRNADIAMYTAKAEGKRQLAVWSPRMHEVVVERHVLKSDLALAVEAGEVRVAYQPIVALDGRGVIGFEALARWDHPIRGDIEPEFFITLAEENGTIVELGRSVLRQACELAGSWAADPALAHMDLSVNLSPRQVLSPNLAAEVAAIVAAAGLDPRRLILEMTEGALFGDIESTIDVLRDLPSQGIRIAIDDFGTGYSSLRWLRRFPVDMLKLAGEFVVDEDDGRGQEFARAMVSLGRTLDLQIVAEGIETEEQAERMTALGCDYGQGFIFSRAIAADDLPAMVKRIARTMQAGAAMQAGGAMKPREANDN